MADRDRAQAAGSSGALASAVAGAVIGAAGLAWWLLAEAERRRSGLGVARRPRFSRLQSSVEASASEVSALHNPPKDRELHQKVQELNQAIETVRRQLEQLQPQR